MRMGGGKRDSQGKKKRWKGGKIYAAVTRDGDGVERSDRPRKFCPQTGCPSRTLGNLALTACPNVVRRTDKPSTPRFYNYPLLN